MSKALLVICFCIALSNIAQGAPILDELYSGFVFDSQQSSVPTKEGAIVKRRAYTDNSDARIKQISLQSLIGEVEDNLFNTALSVSSVAQSHEGIVPVVTPAVADADDGDRSITKRDIDDKETATTATFDNGQEFVLQTTQKVAATNGLPAHILIDRVVVQPQQGDLPFIPTFQVYHNKTISAKLKEANASSTGTDDSSSVSGTNKSTEIHSMQQSTNLDEISETPTTTTISDASETTLMSVTEVTTAAGTAPASTTDLSSTTAAAVETSSTAATTTTTTKLPLVQLKEAEEELKEKVAEIEAEPVILSARV